MAVYAIVNRVDGRHYVGASTDLHKRLLVHYQQLAAKKHHSPELQVDWDAQGPSDFEVVVLERVDDVSVLKAREQFWMDRLRSYEVGYNVSMDATCPMGGRKHSQKTLNKFKERKPRSGWSMAETTKAKLSAAHTGKRLSAETRAKMSEARKGRKVSPETRAKLSQSLKRTFAEQKATQGYSNGHRYEAGHKSGMTGKRHTTETLRKMAESANNRHSTAHETQET